MRFRGTDYLPLIPPTIFPFPPSYIPACLAPHLSSHLSLHNPTITFAPSHISLPQCLGNFAKATFYALKVLYGYLEPSLWKEVRMLDWHLASESLTSTVLRECLILYIVCGSV